MLIKYRMERKSISIVKQRIGVRSNCRKTWRRLIRGRLLSQLLERGTPPTQQTRSGIPHATATSIPYEAGVTIYVRLQVPL
jgi:hypothetical protein